MCQNQIEEKLRLISLPKFSNCLSPPPNIVTLHQNKEGREEERDTKIKENYLGFELVFFSSVYEESFKCPTCPSTCVPACDHKPTKEKV